MAFHPSLQSIPRTVSCILFLLYLFLLCNDTAHTAMAEMSYVNTTVTYSIRDAETIHTPHTAHRSALLSVELIKLFTWHMSLSHDITLKRNLTVTDSFLGKDVHVDVERVITDDSCEIKMCGMCGGLKYVQGKSGNSGNSGRDSVLSQIVTTPCPLCVGLGIVTMDGCAPFRTSRERINVIFPRGSRPGHEVVYKALGNAYYHNNQFLIGDLKVVIEAIENDNFVVLSDHVSLTLTLSPSEAVNGFIFETLYISDEILRVERKDKVTIPGSSIRLKGLGLPLLSAANVTNEKLLPEHRDDLVIHFELEEEREGEYDDDSYENNENNDNDDNDSIDNVKENGTNKSRRNNYGNTNNRNSEGTIEISPSGTDDLVLSSQEYFDNIVERNDRRRDDRALRNMLLFLTKQHNQNANS